MDKEWNREINHFLKIVAISAVTELRRYFSKESEKDFVTPAPEGKSCIIIEIIDKEEKRKEEESPITDLSVSREKIFTYIIGTEKKAGGPEAYFDVSYIDDNGKRQHKPRRYYKGEKLSDITKDEIIESFKKEYKKCVKQ